MRQPKHRRNRLPQGRPVSPDVVVSTPMFPDAVSRARWLFDFLRMELDSISIEAWRRLRKEAWGFVDDGESVIEPDNAIGLSNPLQPDVDPGALRDLQEEIRRGIQRVHDGRWWVVKGPTQIGIARWGQVVRKGHTSRQVPHPVPGDRLGHRRGLLAGDARVPVVRRNGSCGRASRSSAYRSAVTRAGGRDSRSIAPSVTIGRSVNARCESASPHELSSGGRGLAAR